MSRKGYSERKRGAEWLFHVLQNHSVRLNLNLAKVCAAVCSRHLWAIKFKKRQCKCTIHFPLASVYSTLHCTYFHEGGYCSSFIDFLRQRLFPCLCLSSFLLSPLPQVWQEEILLFFSLSLFLPFLPRPQQLLLI